MPNWKKVITSGSNAELNNINSSGTITGTHKGVGSGANNKVFFEGDGGPAKLASANQSTTYLNFGQNSLGIVANNEDTFNVNDDGLVRVGTIGESHGTKALQVHGDISCSGNIHLEPGNLNQTVFVTTGSAGTDRIRFGIGIAAGEIPGTALTVSGSISSSGFVSASSFSGDGSGLTNVSATISGDTFATDLKIGRDSTDLIDFSTADNVIGFRVGNNDEMKLTTTALHPATSNGSALGLVNRQWSDLFLAEGAVINFDNGDVTMTQTGNDLAIAGTTGTSFVGDITASGNISASGTITGNSIVGTIGTATQNSITSIGTLDDLTVTGNITANGNIVGDDGTSITNIASIGLDSIEADANGNTTMQFQNTQIQAEVDGNAVLTLDSTKVTVGDTAGLGLFVDTHITASGNISASGNVFATDLIVGGTQFTDVSSVAGHFAIGNSGGGSLNLKNITGSGHISASGTITTDKFKANLEAGVDNSVLIKDADGFIKTDEIDERVWSNGQLLSGDGGALSDDFIPYTSDGSSGLLDTTNLRWVSNKLGIGVGAVTPPKTLTVAGDISASGGFHVSSSGNVMINSDNTGSMATHLGAFSVNYGNDTQLTGSLAANGDGYGDIVKIGGTTTIKGNMYYLDTDSTWTLTNATDDSAGADKLLAIALGTNSDIDGMLLKGFVHLNPAGTIVVGAALYMRAGTGATTFDKDTGTGNINRIVGYGLTSDGHVYFNPDSTFVEVA